MQSDIVEGGTPPVTYVSSRRMVANLMAFCEDQFGQSKAAETQGALSPRDMQHISESLEHHYTAWVKNCFDNNQLYYLLRYALDNLNKFHVKRKARQNVKDLPMTRKETDEETKANKKLFKTFHVLVSFGLRTTEARQALSDLPAWLRLVFSEMFALEHPSIELKRLLDLKEVSDQKEASSVYEALDELADVVQKGEKEGICEEGSSVI